MEGPSPRMIGPATAGHGEGYSGTMMAVTDFRRGEKMGTNGGAPAFPESMNSRFREDMLARE